MREFARVGRLQQRQALRYARFGADDAPQGEAAGPRGAVACMPRCCLFDQKAMPGPIPPRDSPRRPRKAPIGARYCGTYYYYCGTAG